MDFLNRTEIEKKKRSVEEERSRVLTSMTHPCAGVCTLNRGWLNKTSDTACNGVFCLIKPE